MPMKPQAMQYPVYSFRGISLVFCYFNIAFNFSSWNPIQFHFHRRGTAIVAPVPRMIITIKKVRDLLSNAFLRCPAHLSITASTKPKTSEHVSSFVARKEAVVDLLEGTRRSALTHHQPPSSWCWFGVHRGVGARQALGVTSRATHIEKWITTANHGRSFFVWRIN